MYLNHIKNPKYKLLTPEEELDAIILAQCGCPESLDLLVKRNVSLIWHTLKKLGVTAHNKDFEDDLFQIGAIGLITGIMKFDYNSGNRLSTYAITWIREGVMRAKHQGITQSTMNTPVHHSRVVGLLIRADNEGFDITEDNCYAVYTHMCSIRDINVEFKEVQVRQSFVAWKAVSFSGNDVYSNEDGDGNGCYFDTLAIDQLNPEETLRKEQSTKRVIQLIDDLGVKNPRDKDIIKERFGLIGDPDGCTLEALAEKHGCTRENIRLIQNRMLKILKQTLKFEGITGIGDML